MSAPIVSDGTTYECMGCGARWTAEPRLPIWPIGLRWYRRGAWRLSRHGVEVGYAAPGKPIVATVISIGPLRATFGLRKVAYVDAHRTCAAYWCQQAGGDA